MALPERSLLSCHQTQLSSRSLQGQENILVLGVRVLPVPHPAGQLLAWAGTWEHMETVLHVLSCIHLFGQILSPFF